MAFAKSMLTGTVSEYLVNLDTVPARAGEIVEGSTVNDPSDATEKTP